MANLEIDFPALQEIAVKGVRRTAVFLGIGVNAAANPDLRDYELSGVAQFRFVPADADQETVACFKKEFSRWIVACGFRELIETFSVFLDEVHRSCLVIRAMNDKASMESILPLDKGFRRHRRGLQGKLDKLRAEFAVEMSDPSSLLAINRARNCLVHRLGIVARQDCNDGSQMAVTWRGIDLCIETEAGERVAVHPMSEPTPSERIVVPAHGWVKGVYCQREKAFPMKSVISFSPGELAEICYFFIDSANEVMTSAQIYSKGVNLRSQ